MLLLISDANILIDIEAAELLKTLFKLPYQFAIPDILYVEEIIKSCLNPLLNSLPADTHQPSQPHTLAS